MIEINLFDNGFPNQPCSVTGQTPQTMRYVRGQTEWSGITVFTGETMFDPMVDDIQSRYKIGWVNGDARCFRPYFYEHVQEVAHKFDAVMTHDASLLATGAPFIKTIRGGSWVPLDDWCLPPKTKNVSMILSEKTQLPGHALRHAIADAGLPIDLFGPQYTPIGRDKAIAYRDYRRAIVVEACREKNFFTEHLIDALAFGCLPIYWGCPMYWGAPSFFPRSFRCFDTLEALIAGFDDWTTCDYERVRWVAEELQETARTYAITEDWQIANCLRPFVEAL